MITKSIHQGLNPSGGTIDGMQEDAWTSSSAIGTFNNYRAKRDGRNPSTGARGSSKYGISMVHKTNIGSLADSDGQLIY